jgi:hypothetical protein
MDLQSLACVSLTLSKHLYMIIVRPEDERDMLVVENEASLRSAVDFH